MAQAFIFSDLHASRSALGKIEKYLSSRKGGIRVLLFAGDILNQGVPVSFLEYLEQWLDNVALPFLWVSGNNDFGSEAERFSHNYPTIDGRERELLGHKFTGANCSSLSRSDADDGECCLIEREKIAGSIFITHYPPPGIFNYVKTEKELSPADKNLNLAHSPLLHICGHIHDQSGLAYLGKTKVVKLGAVISGVCATIDLQTLKVNFLKI